MGRNRKNDTDLPQRLHFKHGAYYYVSAIDGESVWQHFGRDKQAAIAKAENLNAMKRQERLDRMRMERSASEEVRKQILERADYKCAYCGATEDLGVDHFIPFSKGGSTERFNMVACCHSCNARKSDSDPLEFLLDAHGLRQAVAKSVDEFFRQNMLS